ncbi:hypothetical protein K458DRAFT_293586, partial [Lentithecium fluviatile CBS 122367]
FLKLYKKTRQRLRIEVENIYNIDKIGIALGVYINTRVLIRASKKANVKLLENYK